MPIMYAYLNGTYAYFLRKFDEKTTIYLATSQNTEVCARAFGSVAFHWLSAVTRAVINKISSWEATTTHFLLDS